MKRFKAPVCGENRIFGLENVHGNGKSCEHGSLGGQVSFCSVTGNDAHSFVTVRLTETDSLIMVNLEFFVPFVQLVVNSFPSNLLSGIFARESEVADGALET